MTDQSAEVARFFMDSRGMPNAERTSALRNRFPDLDDTELRRGIEIAQELLRAEAGEYDAEVDELRAEQRRRREARGLRA